MRLPKRNSSSQPQRAHRARRDELPADTKRPPWALGSRRERRAFVGVDIGATAVKLVELSRRAASAPLRARTWGVEPLPPGAVEAAKAGTNISDPAAVGEAIRRLRRRIGTRARAAALAVPHTAAATKTLRLDAGLGDEEMELEVALEAERHLPFPPDAMALDYETSHLCLDDPALVEVHVVACHRDQVRTRELAAAAGGLKAAVVELETMALARAAHWLCPAASAERASAPMLLAALGASTATLLAARGEEVVFARQEPLAADSPRVDGGALAEELARQVVRLVRLGSTALDAGAPAGLLLVGGRAGTPGLAALAAQRLQLNVEVAQPWAVLGNGAEVAAQDADGARLMVAFGLARRGWAASAPDYGGGARADFLTTDAPTRSEGGGPP